MRSPSDNYEGERVARFVVCWMDQPVQLKPSRRHHRDSLRRVHHFYRLSDCDSRYQTAWNPLHDDPIGSLDANPQASAALNSNFAHPQFDNDFPIVTTHDCEGKI
ncbi:hypothetical protein Pst134EB_018196 [Puccinia striiformis f. sp. tritici]|nr:hypothetical protein Pst134EB_018196 [Puccinia striiformis f. sp. tritici]